MFIDEKKLLLDCQVGREVRGGHVRWTRKVLYRGFTPLATVTARAHWHSPLPIPKTFPLTFGWVSSSPSPTGLTLASGSSANVSPVRITFICPWPILSASPPSHSVIVPFASRSFLLSPIPIYRLFLASEIGVSFINTSCWHCCIRHVPLFPLYLRVILCELQLVQYRMRDLLCKAISLGLVALLLHSANSVDYRSSRANVCPNAPTRASLLPHTYHPLRLSTHTPDPSTDVQFFSMHAQALHHR
jgi:hypothetical protein